jgi:chemotaxis signal transduction protein
MQSAIPVKVGSVWLALDALRVQEILGALEWVPIPHASPHVPGVLAWRGRAVAVFDLFLLAEVTNDALVPGLVRARTVIVEARSCALAMPVDAVHEVQPLGPNALRPPRATRLRHSSAEIDMFSGPVPVLDLDAVVDSLLSLEGEARAG